jgi:hypothetical protein
MVAVKVIVLNGLEYINQAKSIFLLVLDAEFLKRITCLSYRLV